MDHVKYKTGYRNVLAEAYSIQTDIKGHDSDTGFARLTPDGLLFIRKGYAWDGASKPAINTKNFVRGSLVHDVLFQCMRLGYIDRDKWFTYANDLLYTICREDGMSWFRASYVRLGVQWFAFSATQPDEEPEILTAP